MDPNNFTCNVQTESVAESMAPIAVHMSPLISVYKGLKWQGINVWPTDDYDLPK